MGYRASVAKRSPLGSRSLTPECPADPWKPLPVISRQRARAAFRAWGVEIPELRGGPPRGRWVYFAIAPRTCIKVGWSRNPVERLRNAHRDWSINWRFLPLVLIESAGQSVELAIHRALAEFRCARKLRCSDELFALHPRVFELVALLRAGAESCFAPSTTAFDPSPVRHCSICRKAGHECGACPMSKQRAA